MKSLTTVFCIFCVVILALPGAAGAESARSLVDKGNELYDAGSYDEALKAYEEAAQQLPESGEVSFNKGNGYFRKGDYQKAREAYEAAALHAGDPSLEARSQFNLGNVAFAESGELLEEDMQKALDRYGLSIRHYQNALRIDPNLDQAAENIEMARLRVKDLLDQIKNREEEAKERRKQQEELKKQLEEAVREQESEIADNDSLRERMARDPRYPDESFRDETQKLASDQGATREKTEKIAQQLKAGQCQMPAQSQQKETGPEKEAEEASPQIGDSNPPAADEHDAGRNVSDHLESAMGAQESALDRIGGSELHEARDHQEKALQELKQALSKLEEVGKDKPAAGQDKTGDGQQGQQEEPGQQGEQGQQDNPEEQGGDQSEQPSAGQDQEQDQDQEQTGKGDQKDSASPDAGQAQRQDRERADDRRQKSPQPGKEGGDRKTAAIMREKPEDILKEERENRLQLERSHKGAYRPAEKDW